MSYTTPKYGITTPDRETEFRNLGAETKAMGVRLEQVLADFDYNGTDPDAVSARVIAAENAIAALQPEVAKIKSGVFNGTVAGTGGNNAPQYWTAVQTYNFPTPYPAGTVPSVVLTADGGAGQIIFAQLAGIPTNTGFQYRLVRTGVAPVACPIHWHARA